MYDRNLQEDLSPEAFDATVSGAKGDDEATEAAIKEPGMGEAMKVGLVMPGVVAKTK